MKIIARIHNDYKEKFGIPRQSGLVPETEAYIVFEPEYRNESALRELENFSHIWLIWQFSANANEEWRPTVRPPRLGGNKRVGVFATRSPFRPNPIGLSSVKLIDIRKTKKYGSVLVVSGADLMDMTPIYDIKPYVSYTDSHPDAVCGFADCFKEYSIDVVCSEELLMTVAKEKRDALLKVLSNDPRPSYQNDEDRIYSMRFAEYEIKFRVNKAALNVEDIVKVV